LQPSDGLENPAYLKRIRLQVLKGANAMA